MRWDDEHESPDIVDRRGEGPVADGGGGGLFFLVFWLLRQPWGWIVLLVGAVGYFGLRWSGALDAADSRGLHGWESTSGVAPDHESPEVHFVGFVLDDVQTTWSNVFFAERGRPYRHAKLVLYTDSTRTGCGIGSAATGPFYCPIDEQIYLDLGFFHELSGKLGARGQFAQAYVIAHEMGHHVQKLLGVDMSAVGSARGATSGSVRLELQADCYAGIWAHSTHERNLLESGDIESALGAAAAVGDDRLQRMATGTVSPESWTHGSSAERKRWFTRGYTSGKTADCDTFGASSL